MHQRLREGSTSQAGEPGDARHGNVVASLYEHLHGLAHRHLSQEWRRHTLQTTELIHEAYLRLSRTRFFSKVSPGQCLGLAARAMREVLVDHARRRKALKRGGGLPQVTLAEDLLLSNGSPLDLIALDEALVRLEHIDPQLMRIVELRFFGGLTRQQAAEAMGVSKATLRREWQVARLWLSRELCG